ncbi:hypothetical protein Y032_0126g1321 [Ancylostoma ceylanicum]|uniref:Uncharacterized protein n=1 Tax=Ancylostoma ceylanicum TaxID=53326 RepID=A0A016T8G1_9BILA|nr:hypothetical protein Y032_0126g1321 [Ancylostoma ceylanicum]
MLVEVKRCSKIHQRRSKKKEDSEEMYDSNDHMKIDGVQEHSGGKEEERITKKKEESDEMPGSDGVVKSSDAQEQKAINRDIIEIFNYRAKQ